MKHRILAALGGAMLLLLGACGSGTGGDADGTPLAGDEVLVGGRTARTYFAQNCASCHGMQREGRLGPPLTPERLTQDSAAYIDVIANGRPGTAMPGWGSRLNAADIEALVGWLMSTPGGGR